MTLLIWCQAKFLSPYGSARSPQCAQEFLEQGSRVVRTGSSLRMVLDPEDGQFPMAKAFDRTVIQVDVRHLEVACTLDQAVVPLHGKPVVLRGNQDSAGIDLFHWMIPAAMAIGHLGG